MFVWRSGVFLVRALVSLSCLYFGVRLLMASEELIAVYRSWGFSPLMMKLAAALQILGALMLWFRFFEKLALFLIALVVVTALFTHVRMQNEWQDFLPGIFILSLLVVLFSSLRRG